MILSNFRLRLILWVVQLLIVISVLAYCLMVGQFYVSFFLLILLILGIFGLFRHVDKTNRDLAHFFLSIKFDDFTLDSGLEQRGESFAKLYEGFDLINQKFLDIRAEKEAEHQFLQTLVRHMDMGLLCINGQDEIILMNPALQKLLHKSYLVKLEGLKKVSPVLYETVQKLVPGNRELLKISIQNKLLHLSIQSVEIVLRKELYRLVSIQNIQAELENQELIAWQKLIRILTHEIMNSVAPISSLSGTLQTLLKDKQALNQAEIEKFRKSIAVIERRSEGLLGFTETYRALTRIPPPKFKELNAPHLVEQVLTLLETELEKKNISIEQKSLNENLVFNGDPHLLEQVLINILKNAIEALENTPKAKIEVLTFKGQDGKIGIQISDNGPGIAEDKLDQIFIPFFTTKENGSGIGLSLSRQILRMHKGSLEIHSTQDKGTTVNVWV